MVCELLIGILRRCDGGDGRSLLGLELASSEVACLTLVGGHSNEAAVPGNLLSLRLGQLRLCLGLIHKIVGFLIRPPLHFKILVVVIASRCVFTYLHLAWGERTVNTSHEV